MKVNTSSFTIAEYCEQMSNGGIVVNHEYQRTDKVWPTAARSYLIETILLGFPVPKLALYQTTDLKTRRTRKEIVDGQQRSQAIRDFLEDKLRLSPNTTFARKTFSQLEPEDQQKFVDYGLSVDVFVGATANEIRQVFRRMNSYTVPLNPQEQRHATHQGELKWFVVNITERYSGALKQLGVFSEKQLSRMSDASLLSDIAFTFEHGIRSASEANLNRYYSDNEESFRKQSEIDHRLSKAIDFILECPDLHQSSLMKSYNFYSLILAISHAQMPCSSLNSVFNRQQPLQIRKEFAIPNLTALAAAVDEPARYLSLRDFVTACSKATNRIDPRNERFKWMSVSLEARLLP